jgi:hypothetical protein
MNKNTNPYKELANHITKDVKRFNTCWSPTGLIGLEIEYENGKTEFIKGKTYLDYLQAKLEEYEVKHK